MCTERHDNIVQMTFQVGLDTQPTVTLSTYLDAAHDDGNAKPDAFAHMLGWWAE
jgi:hypothetical protein